MNKLLLLSSLLILSSSLHSSIVGATTMTTNEKRQQHGLLRSVSSSQWTTKKVTTGQHQQHRKLAPPQCDDGTCRKKCSDCSSFDPECNPTHPQTCVASSPTPPPTPSPTLSPVTPSPTPLVSLFCYKLCCTVWNFFMHAQLFILWMHHDMSSSPQSHSFCFPI